MAARQGNAAVSRQLLAEQFGLDGEKVEKRYAALRPAFGLDALAKWADDLEEALPASESALDFVFGKKPKTESHDVIWWQAERPRPHRGPTADPTIPAKARMEYDAEEKRMAKLGADKAEIALTMATDKKEAEEGEAAAEWEHNSTVEAQMRRLSFFGRPAQKYRLVMRERQTERQEREHQAAMFAHLKNDAESEFNLQEKKNKAGRASMNKAASSAAGYRAEERGARQAVVGLNISPALEDAKIAAEVAAEKYKEKAEVDEAIARKGKLEMEKASEIMLREEEKIRCCKSAIKFNKMVARELVAELGGFEEKIIIALLLEERLLTEFKEVWVAKLKKVPAGSPAAASVQAQVDVYDQRIHVVFMEKRMFDPQFVKPATAKGKESVEQITFAHTMTPKGIDLKRDPPSKDFTWVEKPVKPGSIIAGKGTSGPPLMLRKKVVLEKEKDEFPDIKLPEEACKSLQDEDIIVRTDFFGTEGIGKFLSRAAKEKGDVDVNMSLSAHEFSRIWGQDKRHKVLSGIATCSARLRYTPKVKWLTTWVDKKGIEEKALLSNSLNLGPAKLPYSPVLCPPLHPQDRLNKINAFDGQPRCYGKIVEWLVEPGDAVVEGQGVVEVDVFDFRLVGKKNREGKFVPEQQGVEKGIEHWTPNTNRVTVCAAGQGTITGMMRPAESKIIAFENLALIDIGEPGWEKVLLPMTEWPE